ncbi:DNA polymerase III subunit beta [Spiroplasma eriocheiris]|uniref:Beta sliding clamp n=1 Tax=Spiroplasma eriocheiris TaxID=315358 RepID=A0A0H3XH90_9MOLU|nr:DNA polymerase III subunit beta [Spiroplasma eriocheiris]AHF57142.1 DNA polymerase III beta subunit [Spiroplasma eriocheiris CCTCC M 207170]AKM53610.1 DNA polymerase III subunit beta [Spiroplasma eriocheiris]
MIVNIKREKILEELLKVSRIISQRTLIPSLLGILIEVKKDKITFTTSDGDTSIKSEIPVGKDLVIKSIGGILIKNKFIIEVIRKIEDEFITLEAIEGSLVKIKANNFDSILNTLNASDYPHISFDTEGKEITFNNNLLKEIISQTSFAIGEREKRIVFNGLNIRTDKANNLLVITATDSFRLACKKINYTSENDFDVIIPGKFINEIGKLLTENDDDIKMKISDKSVCIILNNTIIQSKIIEGKYPDTTKVIPENFVSLLTLNNRDLIKIIERASVLSNEAMTTIVTLKIKDNKVFITSFTQEIGNSEEEIKDFRLSGTDQTITFNSKYILDALKSFKTKEVTIKMIDETKPLIIVADEEPSLQQLVLPIRSY